MELEEYVLIARSVAPFAISLVAYAMTRNDLDFWGFAIGAMQLPELEDRFQKYYGNKYEYLLTTSPVAHIFQAQRFLPFSQSRNRY